ncbi:hypothetical protein [Candidatus Ferrigenium straubiae]|jgi:hypothetical protein|uniref:hypothetical protein n=1 Tax=Candidatus Ferrigenium straubiae TaxID=2919506 RepID=UPI003F4AC701
MNEFIRGFIKGAKETPRGFFAPVIAIWRLLLDTTESLVEPKNASSVRNLNGGCNGLSQNHHQ